MVNEDRGRCAYAKVITLGKLFLSWESSFADIRLETAKKHPKLRGCLTISTKAISKHYTLYHDF